MTYEFQIITVSDKDCEGFLDDFNQRLQWTKQRGYQLSIATNTIEDSKAILISMQLQGSYDNGIFRDDDIVYIFKHQLAEILAEHIVKEWENEFLWKEIQRSCKGHSLEEKQLVFEKSSIFMSKCHDNESLNLLMNYGRKNRIAHRLFDFMRNERQIVVEGFITFYLRDYLNEIKFSVELAEEELKNQKEYNDFVNLLRYFVDTQVSRLQEVNLMIDDSGQFYLWDGDGTKIDEHFMNYYLEDTLMDDINLDDVLVSILITIAPRKIVLHNSAHMPTSEPVQMIRKVFKERISECNNCERCRASGVKPLSN